MGTNDHELMNWTVHARDISEVTLRCLYPMLSVDLSGVSQVHCAIISCWGGLEMRVLPSSIAGVTHGENQTAEHKGNIFFVEMT